MKVVFIINNKDNRLAKVLPGIERCCQQSDIGAIQFVFTQWRKHAIVLAKKATEAGCQCIIAVGGDGTLNEVVNGVLTSKISTHDHPAIGLLPFGSANDFARTAGISSSIEKLIERIRFNTTREIDLGKITIKNTLETHYFINIAGVGLGSEVVKNIERSSSVFGPGFNYFKQIIKGFIHYRKKEVSCTGKSWQWEGKLLQMAVANGSYFGNAICVAPDAKLTDGQFQVVVFGDLSIWHYLKNFFKLKKGVKIDHPEVQYHVTHEISIDSNESCGIEADGEYVGPAPAIIKVLPKAIRFIMPTGIQ